MLIATAIQQNEIDWMKKSITSYPIKFKGLYGKIDQVNEIGLTKEAIDHIWKALSYVSACELNKVNKPEMRELFSNALNPPLNTRECRQLIRKLELVRLLDSYEPQVIEVHDEQETLIETVDEIVSVETLVE